MIAFLNIVIGLIITCPYLLIVPAAAQFMKNKKWMIGYGLIFEAIILLALVESRTEKSAVGLSMLIGFSLSLILLVCLGIIIRGCTLLFKDESSYLKFSVLDIS